jgi:hypothetical protein
MLPAPIGTEWRARAEWTARAERKGGRVKGDSMKTITVACDECQMRATTTCEDCVVSFLLGRDPDDAVVIDADEARAMRMLEQAGLLPTLKFKGRAG